jgi:DNA ligase-1
VYDPDKHDVVGWSVSEKLDGVRALWCPEREGFFSRSNKPLHVPPSWIEMMQDVGERLDGEFFLDRGEFQACVSAVRKKAPTDADFRGIRYVVFDCITEGNHNKRLAAAIAALLDADIDIKGTGKVWVLKHYTVQDMDTIDQMYRTVTKKGGEGLMFRNPAAGYEMKRTGNLLKWKPSIDGTAIVTGMVEGEGKHVGRMGKLVCIDDENGACFGCGTGFSDAERQEWWDGGDPKGVSIRWRAMERTKDGVPRHPVYICINEGD